MEQTEALPKRSQIRISLSELGVYYPRAKRWALEGVSCSIQGPGLTLVCGLNGAGKSTLLGVIAGVYQASRGEVSFELSQGADRERPLIGYAPERVSLHPEETPLEHLSLIGSLRGLSGEPFELACVELIEALELRPWLHHPAGTLSRGVKQRVHVAQALIASPYVTILDEPSTGLDPSQRARLFRLLKSRAQRQLILLSTHLTRAAQPYIDHRLTLEDGQLLTYR